MRDADELAARGTEVLTAEVCVVGSGAGGAVAASRLAEAGFATILLEEGQHVPTSEMTQDELGMLPRLFRDAGRQTTRDQSISVLQGCALGGSTSHNTGLCVPIDDERWREWETLGAVPLPYSEFRRELDGVLEAIRARTADDDEINRNNEILRAGATQQGWSHFIARHNRIRCSGCGYCTLGCVYNRKVSVVHAFLPGGVAAGLDIVVGARVSRIEGGDGRRVVHIETSRGSRLRIESPVVVLAAGAIHSPLILRASGLAPRRAGEGLRLHPFSPVGAIFDEDVVPWRGVPQTVLIDEFARDSATDGSAFHLLSAAGHPAFTSVMAPSLGRDLQGMMQNYRQLAMGGVLLHDSTQGRVRSGRDGRARIDYWPESMDQRGFRHGIRRLAELYLDLGARRIVLPFRDCPTIDGRGELDRIDEVSFRRHTVSIGSVHPQSTCSMGRSIRDSVTSSGGEVHGARGVFVADTSLFPSSVGIPPQVTTMALASAVAAGIVSRRSELVA